jgi:adenylate kinase
MTELHATDQTLPGRVAAIQQASADLVILLERITETIADQRQHDANRGATVENLQLCLTYAKRIREAIS